MLAPWAFVPLLDLRVLAWSPRPRSSSTSSRRSRTPATTCTTTPRSWSRAARSQRSRPSRGSRTGPGSAGDACSVDGRRSCSSRARHQRRAGARRRYSRHYRDELADRIRPARRDHGRGGEVDPEGRRRERLVHVRHPHDAPRAASTSSRSRGATSTGACEGEHLHDPADRAVPGRSTGPGRARTRATRRCSTTCCPTSSTIVSDDQGILVAKRVHPPTPSARPEPTGRRVLPAPVAQPLPDRDLQRKRADREPADFGLGWRAGCRLASIIGLYGPHIATRRVAAPGLGCDATSTEARVGPVSGGTARHNRDHAPPGNSERSVRVGAEAQISARAADSPSECHRSRQWRTKGSWAENSA